MPAIAGSSSDVVDLYNIATDSWTTAQLSLPRNDLAAASSGNSMMLAGGVYTYYGALDWKVETFG